ncbi:hypothetical protein SteCoe_2476 [Stentor coeruleus]|uniref:Translin-associated factor X-interacting protein 1 N-terminal domain-containing protein n=1 Tax=Stentor coeruleus TaxID=5963 RepID=A0A1R2CZJ6_9CILI|nr:hypothetical protein SteCoe_2476 [Stentor coeruleus]
MAARHSESNVLKIQNNTRIRKLNSESNIYDSSEDKPQDIKYPLNNNRKLSSTPSPLKHKSSIKSLEKITKNPQFTIKKPNPLAHSINIVAINKSKYHLHQNNHIDSSPEIDKSKLYNELYGNYMQKMSQEQNIENRLGCCKTFIMKIFEIEPELKPFLLEIQKEYEKFIDCQKESLEKQERKIRHLKMINKATKSELDASISLNMSWSSRFEELNNKYASLDQLYMDMSNINLKNFNTKEENWKILIRQNQMLKESLLYEREKFAFYKQRVHISNIESQNYENSKVPKNFDDKEILIEKTYEDNQECIRKSKVDQDIIIKLKKQSENKNFMQSIKVV